MGKSAGTSLRQRKSQTNGHAIDESDDDVFGEAADAAPGSRHSWLAIIAVLVLANVLLGYGHLRRKASKNKQAVLQEEALVVKTMSEQSLLAHIAGHPNGTLVYFYTPDCTYCQKLAPEFEAAAKALQKIADTSLVSVDASLAPSALKNFSVTRFPSLLWFRRGELLRHVPYSVRSTEKILEFVDQSLQPSVIDFASHADFDEAVPQLRTVLTGESLPVVVGFGRTPSVYEALQQAGEKFRGSTAFLFVKDAREDDPNIRAYFRNPDADQEFTGTLGFQDLENWLQPLMESKKEKLLSKQF